MSIQIFVKTKVIGDRKKYKSLEEMPEGLRQAFERSISGTDSGTQGDAVTAIVVNGKSYSNTAAMPPDIRAMYTQAIKALRNGKTTYDPASLSGERISSANMHNQSIPYTGPGSLEPKSSFSSLPRWLIIGGALIVAFMFLYVIIYTLW